MIAANAERDYIRIEYEDTDGSHIRQLIDFRNVSLLFLACLFVVDRKQLHVWLRLFPSKQKAYSTLNYLCFANLYRLLNPCLLPHFSLLGLGLLLLPSSHSYDDRNHNRNCNHHLSRSLSAL